MHHTFTVFVAQRTDTALRADHDLLDEISVRGNVTYCGADRICNQTVVDLVEDVAGSQLRVKDPDEAGALCLLVQLELDLLPKIG
jgi:hypothetical protein